MTASSGWATRRPESRNKALYGSSAWKAVRLAVLRRDGYWCQVRLSPKCVPDLRIKGNAHCDHVVSVVRGGPALDPSNLRSACRACNLWLGAKLGRERQKAAMRIPRSY